MGEALEPLIEQACQAAARSLDEYAPTEIVSERYTEREPHPSGQEAFTVRARFPWHTQLQVRAKVEVTLMSPLCGRCEGAGSFTNTMNHWTPGIHVYSLEEVIAEKLRAILQQKAKVGSQRQWARSRARDYYDLWRILTEYKDSLDLTGFDSLLRRKCQVRRVAFESQDDFFPPQILADVARTWEQSLGPLVTDLPPLDTVVNVLRPEVENLVALVN